MASDFIICDDMDQFKLPIGRLVWEDLFVPRSFKDKITGLPTAPKYSISIAWAKDEMPAVTAVIDAAIGRLMAQPGFPKYACLKGGGKEAKLLESGVSADQIETFNRKLVYEHDLDRDPHLDGYVLLKANANEKSVPAVVGPNGMKDKITSDRKEEIYRGCYGIALVTLGYHKSAKQLYYKIKGFQKVKNGEPISSNSSQVSQFESFASPSAAQEAFGSQEEI